MPVIYLDIFQNKIKKDQYWMYERREKELITLLILHRSKLNLGATTNSHSRIPLV